MGRDCISPHDNLQENQNISLQNREGNELHETWCPYLENIGRQTNSEVRSINLQKTNKGIFPNTEQKGFFKADLQIA